MATKLRENPLQAANTHTQSKTCYAVWSAGNGESIAAAESGTFFHINDSAVKPIRVNSTSDFYDVHGFAPDDVWAVGTFGAIWHFDGNEWTEVENNPTMNTYDPTWFEAVWGNSSNDLYVCGDNSEILHFDGNEWTYLMKWDRISHNPFPDRWYSLAGLEDGTIYAVGSPYEVNGVFKGGVVRIQPDKAPELLDAPTKTPFINAIAKIPNTNELLLCGGDGTLCRIVGNKITKEATDVVKKNDKFYAIHAIDENNIIVVGWSTLLQVKDGQWSRLYVAGRPFLEGIAYSGNNQLTAVGWMGKILNYDISQKRWSCLHNGRVDETLTIARSNNGGLIASCDGGNLIVASPSGTFSQHLPCRSDVKLSFGLSNGNIVLAGESGYIAEVFVQEDGDLHYHFENLSSADWSAECGVSKHNEVYLGCSDLAVRKWSNGNLSEIEGVDALLKATDRGERLNFEAIFIVSHTQFLVRLSSGYPKVLKSYFVDLEENTAERLDISVDELVAVSEDEIFVIDNASVYRVTDLFKRYTWTKIADIKDHWVSSDETASSALFSDGKIIVGGSRGSVLLCDKDKTVSTHHTGSYSKVTCFSTLDDGVLHVGHRWGRIKKIKLTCSEVSGYSISAPTWWSALAIESGTLMCGQDGAIGLLEKSSVTADIKPNSHQKDYLCSVEIDAELVCLAGVESIVQWRKAEETPVTFAIANYVFTTANFHDSRLYLGTSGGEVFVIESTQLQSRQLTKRAISKLFEKPLPSPVVDLSILEGGVRIVCENGKVYFSNSSTSLLFDFHGVLKRGAISQNCEAAYFAGYLIRTFSTPPYDRMVVVKFNSIDDVDELEFPTGYNGKLLTREVSAYAPDDKNGFWFGGQSGELVITVDGNWYQVSTGIGNHLQSVTSKHDRLVVCGRFGAVRFGDMTIFRARIEELNRHVELLAEEAATVAIKPASNLGVVERRVYDMLEQDDVEMHCLPIE